MKDLMNEPKTNHRWKANMLIAQHCLPENMKIQFLALLVHYSSFFMSEQNCIKGATEKGAYI